MKRPKISIIIPIYNVEQYFERCMNSILNQSLKDIEIILIDDGSPDNCPKLCDEYASTDSRIKVIHKKNEGLGFARNSGLELATGEYIAFVDSDDFVDTTMFEKLYSIANMHSLDTVYCGFNNIDNDLKIHPISEVETVQILRKQESIHGVLLNMIACEPSSKIERKYRMSVWHAIYSKKIIDLHNIRFTSERQFISEDIIFHIDYLTKASQIAFIPDPLYYYCYNDNSLTKTFREDRFEKSKVIYHELLNKISGLNFHKPDAKLRVDRFFIGYVRSNIKGICHSKASTREKKKLLRNICYDPVWLNLEDYPVDSMPVKHKMIMLLIKYKMINLIHLFSTIKR